MSKDLLEERDEQVKQLNLDLSALRIENRNLHQRFNALKQVRASWPLLTSMVGLWRVREASLWFDALKQFGRVTRVNRQTS